MRRVAHVQAFTLTTNSPTSDSDILSSDPNLMSFDIYHFFTTTTWKRTAAAKRNCEKKTKQD